MPASATQVCLNVSQIETLHSNSVPKLTPGYFTGAYMINSLTILIASTYMFKCLNIRYEKA